MGTSFMGVPCFLLPRFPAADKGCFEFHKVIHKRGFSAFVTMSIPFVVKAIHEFKITLTRMNTSVQTIVMPSAAIVNIINWSTRPAAARPSPAIPRKNAKAKRISPSSSFQI
jgi:hypothetical protein